MSSQPITPDFDNEAFLRASAEIFGTPKPPALVPPKPDLYTGVPDILKQYPNWVCWKSETRDGKATKVPYNAKTGRPAKADDSSTWVPFEHAHEAFNESDDYTGIGFELGGTSLVGVDFDGAYSAKVIDPYALAILKLLGSPYTETSPSGTGLHTFVECDVLPKGGRKLSKDHTGIEIYHGKEGGRYFTVTGKKVLGEGIPKIEDISLPYLLITQSRDKKFKALWLGDTSEQDGDDSSADFALMCQLAALTQYNSPVMEKYFGASQLGQRAKWTDRADYRQRTITAAIKAVMTGNSNPPSAEIVFHTPALPDPDGDYVGAPAAGQEDGWFPLGDISLIGGASGTGKTTFIFDLLHKQKQGYPVLGHRTFKRLFHVLAYDRGENAFKRTMRRLKLLTSDIPTTPLPLAFGTVAVQNIINEIERLNPTPQIVFIEGLDMLLDDANKKSVVAPFMRKLQEVAAHFHIALIGSVGAPKTKRGADYVAKRDNLSGSESWGRNCETVAIIEFAEDDDGTAPQRCLTMLPRNANAEKFTMQFEGGRLVPIQPTAEAEKKPGRPNECLQTAINFLERELKDGPKTITPLVEDAYKSENICRATIFRAAKEIHVVREGKGDERTWRLGEMHAGGDAIEETGQSPSLLDYGDTNGCEPCAGN